MTGTTHQIIALVAALWILTLHPVSFGPLLGFLAIFAIMIGALTPDLDHPAANLFRRTLGGRVFHRLFSMFSGGHRHFTHSILGIFLVVFLFHFIIRQYIQEAFHPQACMLFLAFLVGYVSHPIADTLTDQGVPWLWPLPWNVKIPPGPEEVRVTTGSFVEIILLRGALLLITFLLLAKHWETVIRFFI